MKAKYLALAAALLGAASFTSCSNEEGVVSEIHTKNTCPKVIYVNVEGGTRVVMGEGNKPVWEKVVNVGEPDEKGDRLNVIALSNDGQKIERTYICTEPSTGEFTLQRDWHYLSDYSAYTGEPVVPFVVPYKVFSYDLVLGEGVVKSEIEMSSYVATQPGKL